MERIIHDLDEICKYAEDVPEVITVELKLEGIVIIMRFALN